jgi:hypothetical protein
MDQRYVRGDGMINGVFTRGEAMDFLCNHSSTATMIKTAHTVRHDVSTIEPLVMTGGYGVMSFAGHDAMLVMTLSYFVVAILKVCHGVRHMND